jgi:hypothetical protein
MVEMRGGQISPCEQGKPEAAQLIISEENFGTHMHAGCLLGSDFIKKKAYYVYG